MRKAAPVFQSFDLAPSDSCSCDPDKFIHHRQKLNSHSSFYAAASNGAATNKRGVELDKSSPRANGLGNLDRRTNVYRLQ
jgi:hypothetical protein